MFFFVILVVVAGLNELAGNFIFGAQMTFFAKISDPLIGGTYMTFLNTVSNLGSKWPNFLSLWLLPKMTLSSCLLINDEDVKQQVLMSGSCLGLEDQCGELGGTCIITTDGYTVQQFLATIIGFLWVFLLGNKILNLERAPSEDWLTTKNDDDKRGGFGSKSI